MDEESTDRDNERQSLRRACREIPKAKAGPGGRESSDKSSRVRRIANILRKSESLRSEEEVAALGECDEAGVLAEAKRRNRRRQEAIDRNKEVEDDRPELERKCEQLAAALESARHLVVYTGAGISTAADIPDYRGPRGIWTLLQQGKQIGKHDLTRADPTLTHMALSKLYRRRYLKFVVSQNCDGLHLRSGLPRRALSEVHGNMYIEICKSCKPNVQYWRLFDTTERTSRFFHKTGRICHVCGGSLEDSIVHFGERGVAQWPLNWTGALHHASKADVILCLGSSLKVLKRYPWLWAMDKPIKKRPAVFIVNLQWTPKDDIAALKINGRCDTVMELVMKYLGLETPKYNRLDDPIFAHTSYLSPKELHTTTQPMLVKYISKDNENEMDTEDPDDDCPLNILKVKMIANMEVPQDLTSKISIRETDMKKLRSFNRCNDANCNQGFCTSKFNLEQTITVQKENEITEKQMNGKFTSSKIKEFDFGVNKAEKSLLEISSDVFDRVDLEMRAGGNNFCNVSILLVNKSKYYFERKNSKSMEINQYDEFNLKAFGTKNGIKNGILNPSNIINTSTLTVLSDESKSKLYNPFKSFKKLKNYSNPFYKRPLQRDKSNDRLEIKESFKPLDFSSKLTTSSIFQKSDCKILNPSFCRKVFTEPIVKHFDRNNDIKSSVLDLSISCNSNVSQIIEYRFDNVENYYNNPIDLFAKVIIQNTISVNHKELQYAYSGLHSIINPRPFLMDYDFKSVFNSFNFIKFAQKLLYRDHPKSIAWCENSNANGIMKIKKPRFPKRKKREPQCKFCYDQYKSVMCKFYQAYNSEKRFEKWQNGKLIMCECCESDTSENSENEADTDEESKFKLNDSNEMSEKKCDDVDLKNSVQISLNDSKTGVVETESVVQAGWFGKGFRKNRKKKR